MEHKPTGTIKNDPYHPKIYRVSLPDYPLRTATIWDRDESPKPVTSKIKLGNELETSTKLR